MFIFCYACYSCSPKMRFHPESHPRSCCCYECDSSFTEEFYDHQTPWFSGIFPDQRDALFEAGCLPPQLQTGKYAPTPDKPQNSATNGFDYHRLTVLQENRAQFQWGRSPLKTVPRLFIPQISPPDNPDRQRIYKTQDGQLVEQMPGLSLEIMILDLQNKLQNLFL